MLEHQDYINSFNGTHKPLAEELLVPGMNKTDTTRLNMFSSHIMQALILKYGEVPKFFSGFENQVGKYSTGFTVAEKDYEVVDIVYRNKFNYSLVLYCHEENYVDVIHINKAVKITEDFGYTNIVPDDLAVGKKFNKGDVIRRNESYDEHMNLMFGRNLLTAYMAFKDLTHEDK